MKKYLTSLLAFLLLPALGMFAQNHLGIGTEVIVPIKPLSNGYGSGYAVSLNYRRFKMTETLIIDASMGYSRISSTQDTTYAISYGYFTANPPEAIKSLFVKAGLAWAFVPNASPYTQPFAGAELGINMGKRNNSTYRSVPMALRLGWMSYINERFLLGLEAKYNMALLLDTRDDVELTTINNKLDHYLSFQLLGTVKLGR